MAHHAVFKDEKNNLYEFRVDGRSIFIYAECYKSAVKKLKAIYGDDTIIE